MIDLPGFGTFTILTGPGGTAWKDATASISNRLGVPIKASHMGWVVDYHDN
ncbi:hypothetical protein Vi05172_g564 [Venturia inaequalis]|nr:hypothetical protein Vi05172_g564 [Venturia inaequalis]